MKQNKSDWVERILNVDPVLTWLSLLFVALHERPSVARLWNRAVSDSSLNLWSL